MTKRPYRPDTGAATAEEAAVRRALAGGTIALAPRASGWVVVTEERDGALAETPCLHPDGEPILPWDTEGLSRWMRSQGPSARPEGPLTRLAARFRR
ncbi:MAG TPA: hypothetical protein VF699_12670 [Caulobacteraceae bacterium]|jgi:hypothetical protein